MRYKSLNESILSVTNPQLKEDHQTPERNSEMTKALVRLGGEHNGTSPAIKKQQKKQAATYWRDRMERKSSNLYGKGGKIIKKKATVKEEQTTQLSSSLVEEQRYIEEYIELLESALEAIAEELECDVEDLLEDLPPKSHVDRIKKKTQDARDAEQKKKSASSQSAYIKSTNNRTNSKGKKLDPYDDYQS